MSVLARTSADSSGIDGEAELSAPLEFDCPRCGHLEFDPLEVIGAGVPVDWRCTSCTRVFNVLLSECEHCAAETVSVALASAEQADPNAVACDACQRLPCAHDAE